MPEDPEEQLIQTQFPIPHCQSEGDCGHLLCYRRANHELGLYDNPYVDRDDPEHPLRKKVVERLQVMQNFGVTDSPPGRAEAYGQIISLWGEKPNTVKYWAGGCDANRSSCGMAIRALWRLLGVRHPRLAPPYQPYGKKAVFVALAHIANEYGALVPPLVPRPTTDANKIKEWENGLLLSKALTPALFEEANVQPGDVIHIENASGRHIFTVTKRIGDRFASIDGGQPGPRGDGRCCGIHAPGVRTLDPSRLIFHGDLKKRPIQVVIKITRMVDAFTAPIIELKKSANEAGLETLPPAGGELV